MSDSNEPKASLPQAPNDEAANPCAGCGGGDRRQFMFKVGLGLMGAGGAAAAVPVVSAMLGPGLRQYPEQWVDLGPVSLYPPGETRFAT
ncbi:MAG: hypothetical protein ACO3EP_05490, partial [Phycisphaerales bacterium]